MISLLRQLCALGVQYVVGQPYPHELDAEPEISEMTERLQKLYAQFGFVPTNKEENEIYVLDMTLLTIPSISDAQE